MALFFTFICFLFLAPYFAPVLFPGSSPALTVHPQVAEQYFKTVGVTGQGGLKKEGALSPEERAEYIREQCRSRGAGAIGDKLAGAGGDSLAGAGGDSLLLLRAKEGTGTKDVMLCSPPRCFTALHNDTMSCTTQHYTALY